MQKEREVGKETGEGRPQKKGRGPKGVGGKEENNNAILTNNMLEQHLCI